MSIFHFTVKIISKGKGQSVIASASYRSGTKMEDKSTGLKHDYSRKTGVDDTLILLPENAPSTFMNREELWNSITESEIKVKDAQLARELEFALPIEWSLHERKEIVKEFIQKNFVDQGMCADIAWHDKGDGNPHVHVLLTMKELDDKKEGKWLSKSCKKYLCRKPNEKEERYLDAKELKLPVNIGFEKVYKFKPIEQDDNKKYVTFTMSEYKEHYSDTHVRIGKAPLDKKVERNDWNDKGNVEKWRKAWADTCNLHLAKDKQVDHRSFERQGKDIIPTIHEGHSARKIEKDGNISERCEYNREVRTTNRLIESIKQSALTLMEDLKHGFRTTINRIKEVIGRSQQFAFTAGTGEQPTDPSTRIKANHRINIEDYHSKAESSINRIRNGISKCEVQINRTRERIDSSQSQLRDVRERIERIRKTIEIKQNQKDFSKMGYREAYNKLLSITNKINSVNDQINWINHEIKGGIQYLDASKYIAQLKSDIAGVDKFKWSDRKTYKNWQSARVQEWNARCGKNTFADYRDLKKHGEAKIQEWVTSTNQNKDKQWAEKEKQLKILHENKSILVRNQEYLQQMLSDSMMFAFKIIRKKDGTVERDMTKMYSYDEVLANFNYYYRYYAYCDWCIANNQKFDLYEFDLHEIPSSDLSITDRITMANNAITKAKEKSIDVPSVDDDWGVL